MSKRICTEFTDCYELKEEIGRGGTVQDFFIKLVIKLIMHLLEISIFSINNDIVRLTKIMNNLVKDCKIRTFKVIFQCLKLVKSFQKRFSVKNN